MCVWACSVSHVILDEADKLFDFGFVEQVRGELLVYLSLSLSLYVRLLLTTPPPPPRVD